MFELFIFVEGHEKGGRLAQTSETVCRFSVGTGGSLGLYFLVSSQTVELKKVTIVFFVVGKFTPLFLGKWL